MKNTALKERFNPKFSSITGFLKGRGGEGCRKEKPKETLLLLLGRYENN
jgi:hypothetical protein